MRKRFLLDTEKLVYTEYKCTFKECFNRYFKITLLGVFFGLFIWTLAFSGLVISPKKWVLVKENKHIIAKLTSLSSNFDSVSGFLNDVQERDDHIYRVISKIPPIPTSVRLAGFGGTDKYSNLESFENSELLISTVKKSDVLLNQLDIQTQSYDTVFQLAKSLNDSLLSSPIIAPVSPNGYLTISSPFGWRFHPIHKMYIMHDGVDFAGNIGSPIYATGKGVVTTVEKNSNGYGNYVVIEHGFKYKTLYAHMSKIYVNVGETINRGQQIGTIGNSGTSTGPHLHYEVVYDRVKRNPLNYYIDDLSNDEYLEMIRSFHSN